MSFNFNLPFSTSIDFVGQKNSEKTFQIVISVFATIGFIWGFYVQQFSHTLLILAAGIALSSLVVLPPWPCWNRNPIKWQQPVSVATANATNETTTQSSSSQKEKDSNRKKK